jgi:hypothetical protein
MYMPTAQATQRLKKTPSTENARPIKRIACAPQQERGSCVTKMVDTSWEAGWAPTACREAGEGEQRTDDARYAA